MPHIIIEYSKNLGADVSISDLTKKMHAALGERLGGVERIKTRAIAMDCAVVGDKGEAGKMIHITLLLLEGRDVATKQDYGNALYGVAKSMVPDTTECAVTLEVRDMEKAAYIL